MICAHCGLPMVRHEYYKVLRDEKGRQLVKVGWDCRVCDTRKEGSQDLSDMLPSRAQKPPGL